MKYLFKRALANNERRAQLTIHVVDKKRGQETQTLRRYQHLFGPNLEYFRGGFKEYIESQMPNSRN